MSVASLPQKDAWGKLYLDGQLQGEFTDWLGPTSGLTLDGKRGNRETWLPPLHNRKKSCSANC